MINQRFQLLIAAILSVTVTFGQKLSKADRAVLSNLRTHVTFLADDKLEGRRAGTPGEKMAADYIISEFMKIGLEPKGDSSWIQRFEIYDGKQVNRPTHFFINGHDLKLNEEYFPLSFSPNANTEAAVAMALTEKGVPWFMDLKEMLDQNKNNPHYELSEAIRLKANSVAEKGATALIVYNSSAIEDKLSFNPRDRREPSAIPVFYLKNDIKKKYLHDESATIDLKLKTDIILKQRSGINVVGFINNGAPTTIVLGAHFDHLGYGEDGNSMHRAGERQVHNGADDNASGTAAIIEVARQLKKSKDKKNNYLFIAFSGEELGLNGSKYFTEKPTVDIASINYMINLDMVGRYDAAKGITIGGIGTSPAWGSLMQGVKQGRNLKIALDSSGTGPSDHTSFYRKNIPVLFFFTGLHSDYHKPTDDFDKINYEGQVQIVKYITELVSRTNTSDKLVFSPTRERQTTTSAQWTVSLGIMPDYTFTGSGVRVDGVSAGKPAEKAGVKTGDIITDLGGSNTSSMEAYMQALSKFKKGDKTKVKFKRGSEVLEADVEF